MTKIRDRPRALAKTKNLLQNQKKLEEKFYRETTASAI
jgi:hypothetical protein